MEMHIQRPLLTSEIIHHINGNKLDNRIENLVLCQSHVEHVRLHYTGYRTDTEKRCRKCGETKSRTMFDAGKRKAGCDPNHVECKACRKAYYAERFRNGLTSRNKKHPGAQKRARLNPK